MTALAFVPRGPILFRENRSVSAGGVLRATEPAPSVFYGAVRARWLMQHGIDFRRYRRPAQHDAEVRNTVYATIGSPIIPGNLRIKGPLRWFDGEWFFPPPENAYTKRHVAVPRQENGDLSDLTDSLRPLALSDDPEAEQRRLLSQWMPLPTLKTFLLQRAESDAEEVAHYLQEHGRSKWQPMNTLFTAEPRHGHKRNPMTLRPEDKHLFSLEMVRTHDDVRAGELRTACWAVALNGIGDESLAPGSVWLGGRSRRCDLAAIEPPQLADIDAPLVAALERRKQCFLYLATPALFELGWRPGDIDGLTLVGAAIGRPITVGGWDMAAGAPRASQRLAPAGSVYFYEGEPSTGWASFVQTHQFESISDQRGEAGFGIALVGVW